MAGTVRACDGAGVVRVEVVEEKEEVVVMVVGVEVVVADNKRVVGGARGGSGPTHLNVSSMAVIFGFSSCHSEPRARVGKSSHQSSSPTNGISRSSRFSTIFMFPCRPTQRATMSTCHQSPSIWRLKVT